MVRAHNFHKKFPGSSAAGPFPVRTVRVAQYIYITIYMYCTSFYFLQNVIIDMKAMLSNAMKGDYLSKNNDSSVRFLSIYLHLNL